MLTKRIMDGWQLVPTWHAMKKEEVLHSLQSDLKGLTKEEVELRLQKFGYNELEKPKRLSPLQIFFSQFKNIFVIMLLGAIIISALVGWYEAADFNRTTFSN